MDEKIWVTAYDGAQIVAVQHGCGIGDAPVNCYLDEYRNWVCGRCMAVYGAAQPLAGWLGLPIREPLPRKDA